MFTGWTEAGSPRGINTSQSLCPSACVLEWGWPCMGTVETAGHSDESALPKNQKTGRRSEFKHYIFCKEFHLRRAMYSIRGIAQ